MVGKPRTPSVGTIIAKPPVCHYIQGHEDVGNGQMELLTTDTNTGLHSGSSLDNRLGRLLAAGDRPLVIPHTTPRCYLSLRVALNLRMPGEETGDWHFLTTFFFPADEPPIKARLTGEGQEVDTTPSLGSRGFRDMAGILVQQEIMATGSGPVWVANHYRAIADLAELALRSDHRPHGVTAQQVNQWLDTKTQVDKLVTNYLVPLRQQKGGRELAKWDAWLKTIRYN